MPSLRYKATNSSLIFSLLILALETENHDEKHEQD